MDFIEVFFGFVIVLCLDVQRYLVRETYDTVQVLCKIQHWLMPPRPGAKISYVLQVVDVPVRCTDLFFDIIEGAVCAWVCPGVNVMNDAAGKLFDAACVVSDCHDILPSFAGWVDGVGPSSKTDALEEFQDCDALFFRCHDVLRKNGRPQGI